MNQGALNCGLVFSGGGARGAFHVGVVKAISALNIQISAISGGSVGALNGAILASAPSLSEGAVRLKEVWDALVCDPPGQGYQLPLYMKFLAAAGLPLSTIGKIVSPDDDVEKGVASLSPIKTIVDEYLDLDALAKGIPLYISAYPSRGGWRDLTSFALAQLGSCDTPDSEFFHVQSLPREDQKVALLASAAIPVIFDSQKIKNKIYTDGGLGGRKTRQGNTPVSPLVDIEMCNPVCDPIIVTHLEDGSFFDRKQFPETTFFEIRPQSRIAHQKGLQDLLSFAKDDVELWVKQGYDDTLHCLGKIIDRLDKNQQIRASEEFLAKALTSSSETEVEMHDAMEQLGSSGLLLSGSVGSEQQNV